ncbi:alpha/beta fold hydrolase [Streptomyces sp. NPDC101166]|uniref:alpha/beta fold hydrolase n=1 Tax=Streptomyces sp. NPDC101166 TaxID=3366120 RepID=UPI00382E1B10
MLNHERRGSGPAVVLVHGLGATKDFFAPVVADLARDHTVVSVDLPGHGGSPAGDTEPTLRRAAAGLAEVVETCGPDQVTLVGWSLGATVAWTYLEEFGDRRVRALVSVEQTPWLLAGDGWDHAAFGTLDRDAADVLLETAGRDPGAVAENLVRGSFAAGSTPDPAMVESLVAQARRTSAAAMHGLLADVLSQDWRERVSAIDVPVLWVHGARSQVYPPEVGAWLAKAVPGSRLELLDDSGHLCFLEQPEQFCGAIRAFLTHETTER